LLSGDVNTHVDDSLDSQFTAFLSVLSDANLTQHVNFPTQYPSNRTLDLVITYTDFILNPKVIHLSLIAILLYLT